MPSPTVRALLVVISDFQSLTDTLYLIIFLILVRYCHLTTNQQDPFSICNSEEFLEDDIWFWSVIWPWLSFSGDLSESINEWMTVLSHTSLRTRHHWSQSRLDSPQNMANFICDQKTLTLTSMIPICIGWYHHCIELGVLENTALYCDSQGKEHSWDRSRWVTFSNSGSFLS